MDCDRVFVALTAAPFPTGAPGDARVERHLLGCEGCRRIAEALRPCEDLFHESLPAAERRGLPRYRTEIAAPIYAAASPRAAAPADGAVPPSSPSPWRRHVNYAANVTDTQVADFTLCVSRRRIDDALAVFGFLFCVAAIGCLLAWLVL